MAHPVRVRALQVAAAMVLLLALWLGRAPAVDQAGSSQAGQNPLAPVVVHRASPAQQLSLPAVLAGFQAARSAGRRAAFLLALQRQAAADALHQDLFLHGVGTQLYTAWNAPMTLKAINWYGFEYAPFVPDGLDRAPLDSILAMLRQVGFNALRITFADETVESNPVVTAGVGANPQLRGLHALDILQVILERAQHFGLRVILCNSRSEAGRGPELVSGMWYTNRYPESSWMNDWMTLVRRFRNDSAFVGADLRNEPHVVAGGTIDENAYFNNGPIWGMYRGTYYHDRDWHYAAQTLGNALLDINPRLLIVVEGVQVYLDPDKNELTGALWGSNLVGVQYDPIVLSRPGQLVYSVHEYGPHMWQADWFSPHTTYQSLARRWTDLWGYLLTAPKSMQAPIFVGEFGTCHNYRECVSSDLGWKQGFWFKSFVRYLHEHPQLGWAYWALNPTGPFHPSDADFYSLVSEDWRHYYPLLTQALASLLSEPDGVWSSRQQDRVLHFTPEPGCSARQSCVAGALPPPAPGSVPVPARAVQIVRNVPYVQPADPYRRGDLYLPQNQSPARPALVMVHGRDLTTGKRGVFTAGLARALAAHGYVVYDIDYRMLGSGGSFPNDVLDVRDAVGFLASNKGRLRVDVTRMGAVGSGIGGYLALMAAYAQGQPAFAPPHYRSTPGRIGAVASFFAPVDLERLALTASDPVLASQLQAYLGTTVQQRPHLYAGASPYNYRLTAVSTIFFHGLADRAAPFGRTYLLYRSLRQHSVPSKLVDLPGSPHSFAALTGTRRQQALGQLVSFLDGIFFSKYQQ